MFYQKRISSRRVTMVMALLFGVAAVQPVFAAESLAATSDPLTDSGESSSGATASLINRLVERGVLSKADSADLLLMAEADAAEARAQRAMTQAALAQAAAAQARLKAVLAMAKNRRAVAETATTQSAISDATDDTAVAVTPAPRVTHRAAPAPAPRVVHVQPAPVPAADELVDDVVVEKVAPPARVVHSTASVRNAPPPPTTRPAPVEVAVANPVKEVQPAKEAPPVEEVIPDDTVRVTYVPEVVKAELREEIKQDVMAQAREENWASPHAFPDWVTKFRLFGDIRFRYEAIRFPTGNANTGEFPNFNLINAGAPFDVTGTVNSAQFNVDQNRSRLRLRARMGAAVDMGQNFSAGLRLATGESNSPVTQNQSLGATSGGQGGNFSKYSLWLDRAFLKYELGGLPDQDFAVSVGRFDKPFFSTSMTWADDLGFDGAVVQGRFPLGEDVTPFYAIGVFPVFNTDLNFATNQPAKFKSDDKWLYGGQVGVTWELGKDISLKFGTAYYLFQDIEGKLSTPYVPFTAADAGDTDASRPGFAQKGNTYMALRDIIPVAGDPSIGGNQNGSVNQFQYFGLASKFAVVSADLRLDFNQFEPFQISLIGEFAKNRSFDATAIAAKALNNRGDVTDASPNGEFLGSDTAWLAGLIVGDVALKERWKWNVDFGYRRVGSDALVDGFVDSDFGGGGTNVKGFTLGANLALSASVKIGVRWFSASEVAGPALKNDIFQMDFTGKF